MNVADLWLGELGGSNKPFPRYKYYANRLARRARQAAILADQAVQARRSARAGETQEAWKQQQLARHWSRQALADEAQAMRSLPKAGLRGDYHFGRQANPEELCRGG